MLPSSLHRASSIASKDNNAAVVEDFHIVDHKLDYENAPVAQPETLLVPEELDETAASETKSSKRPPRSVFVETIVDDDDDDNLLNSPRNLSVNDDDSILSMFPGTVPETTADVVPTRVPSVVHVVDPSNKAEEEKHDEKESTSQVPNMGPGVFESGCGDALNQKMKVDDADDDAMEQEEDEAASDESTPHFSWSFCDMLALQVKNKASSRVVWPVLGGFLALSISYVASKFNCADKLFPRSSSDSVTKMDSQPRVVPETNTPFGLFPSHKPPSMHSTPEMASPTLVNSQGVQVPVNNNNNNNNNNKMPLLSVPNTPSHFGSPVPVVQAPASIASTMQMTSLWFSYASQVAFATGAALLLSMMLLVLYRVYRRNSRAVKMEEDSSSRYSNSSRYYDYNRPATIKKEKNVPDTVAKHPNMLELVQYWHDNLQRNGRHCRKESAPAQYNRLEFDTSNYELLTMEDLKQILVEGFHVTGPCHANKSALIHMVAEKYEIALSSMSKTCIRSILEIKGIQASSSWNKSQLVVFALEVGL